MDNEQVREFPPRVFGVGGDASEQYEDAGDALEKHPNYDERKGANVPFDVTLEEYVAYCRERSAENYTNEMADQAQERFEKYWRLLNT